MEKNSRTTKPFTDSNKLLPRTMYLQLNDVLILSKLIQAHYHVDDLRLPGKVFSVRGEFKFNSESPGNVNNSRLSFIEPRELRTP